MQETEQILVVDDEEIIRIVVADGLQAHGYRVQTAASAEQALRACEEAAFDLALIDLKMPGAMDGLALLGELHRRWPKTVVIVMTGYGTLESAITALRQGAHDYLAKPASIAQIVESVQSGLAKKHEETRRHQLITDLEEMLLKLRRDVELPSTDSASHEVQRGEPDGATGSPAGSIPVGGASGGMPAACTSLSIDSHARQVRRGDELLVLTATEFDVLDYLARHTDRVVMASELAKEILGYELDEADARPIVRVHIQRLRQKLNDDPIHPRYILNVRAKGYRFIG